MHFYRHSGTAPLGGLISTLVAGLGTATSVAVVYAYACHWIPFIYVIVLLTIMFGCLIGGVVFRTAKAGRIRSAMVPAAIGLVAGAAGLYVAWGAHMLARWGLPEEQSPFVVLHAAVLRAYIADLYANGAWGIGRHGAPVSGIPLALVWIVEAGIILGAAAYIPWRMMRGLVYCENCEQWADVEKCGRRLSAADSDALAGRIRAGDMAALRDVPRASGADAYLRLQLACCGQCTDTRYLEIVRITTTIDKKGNPHEKVETLVPYIAITDADAEVLRTAGTPVEAPEAPEAEPEAAGNSEPAPEGNVQTEPG